MRGPEVFVADIRVDAQPVHPNSNVERRELLLVVNAPHRDGEHDEAPRDPGKTNTTPDEHPKEGLEFIITVKLGHEPVPQIRFKEEIGVHGIAGE